MRDLQDDELAFVYGAAGAGKKKAKRKAKRKGSNSNSRSNNSASLMLVGPRPAQRWHEIESPASP